MDLTSQNTAFGLNLATFIRQMAQNTDISRAVPSSVTITDEVLMSPRQFEDKGEAGDDILAVSDSEEVGEGTGRAPSYASSATREFHTEIFIESERAALLVEHVLDILQRQGNKIKCLETAIFFVQQGW